MKKKLAIVGSGISGIASAYYLKEDYDISIFDKNDYLGGHTHTHTLEEYGKKFTLDSGFMVFNKETYPNMLELFKELGVKIRKSDMSFSVSNMENGLEYSGTNFLTLFAQKKNIFSIKYLKFLLDIKKFFKIALRDYNKLQGSNETIDIYCKKNGLNNYFVDNYLAPMAAAVWSTSQDDIYDFPISLLLPFFYNHGLLSVTDQFQWYTVSGGSNDYIKKIIKESSFDIHLEEEVKVVEENDDKVLLRTKNKEYKFDYVILACHSDESLQIFKNISENKKELLSKFKYSFNKAVIHKDESIMPKKRKAWASWNQIVSKKENGQNKTSTIYWLNRLQNPELKNNYFASINPFQEINKDKIIKEINYNHPLFTVENFNLQKEIQSLNSNTKVFFAGAYFGYGFHEDGLKSALNVVDILKKIISD